MRTTFFKIPGLLLLGLLAACGTPEPDNSATQLEPDMKPAPDMKPEPDMRPAVEPDMKDPNAIDCPDGKNQCGGVCADLTTDIKHCGECGNKCGVGTACVDSECTCFAFGKTWCGFGVCTDIANDARHCGECGNQCARGSYCDNGTCTDGGFLGEVIALTNERRASDQSCGGEFKAAVGPLGANALLAEAAQGHAEDMADRGYFEHDTPEGTTPTQRMRAAGYTGGVTGENIAAGQQTPEEVVQAWMDSPGHCRNIMSGSYTEIGIGYHRGGPIRHYWVQNFGAP